MHKKLTEKTCVTVYFCDPHRPWQRNENTNGPDGLQLDRVR